MCVCVSVLNLHVEPWYDGCSFLEFKYATALLWVCVFLVFLIYMLNLVSMILQFSGVNVVYGNRHNFVLEEAVKIVFRKFLGRIRTSGHLILYGDRHDQYLGAFSLFNHPKNVYDAPSDIGSLPVELWNNRYKVTTFGLSSESDWQASSVFSHTLGGCDYKLSEKNKRREKKVEEHDIVRLTKEKDELNQKIANLRQ